MKDLAVAFVKVLANPAAARQVFNIAGERYVPLLKTFKAKRTAQYAFMHLTASNLYVVASKFGLGASVIICCNGRDRFVTFDGIAKACAKAAGAPEPELVHYNPKDFDFGKKKAFPMRDQHFFASVDKVCYRKICKK